ncbi:regulator of telomere elongation helicase 1 homolog [Uloborus diversus]|uniref:regulator of telomere elongation helicase 1 homolog n=1 Tax=Uloborus diversus TaxID=327109 RepID=UPI002409D826|nr:regulator of telomere elongation helicase 1 homolog [Uloborus diversus]
MAECTICGIQVLFPYEPYKVQEDYMTKVLECLQKGVNGILESPTGTGKTLSLLCSSLAWLESRKAQQQLSAIQSSVRNHAGVLKDLKSVLDGITGNWDSGTNFMLPKIIYSSRTHSQLSQAIQELKRSSYKHTKAVALGSRDQLCLHAEVMKATSHTTKVYMCRAKIGSKSCTYHMNYEEKMTSQSDYQDATVVDIEDLLTLGKKHMVCPYYAARNLKGKADIIFTPYNYIIDPKSRRAHGIELQGNVVIFDEAHNIEGACEESMSFQLKSYDLALCINEVTQTMEKVKDFESKDLSSSLNEAPDFTLTDLSILKVMFCELEELLDKAVADTSASDGSKPGDYVIDILSKVELTPKRKEVVLDLLDKIILYHSTSITNIWSSKGAGLQKFSDLLNILYARSSADSYREMEFKKEFSTKYRVFLQYETPNKSQNNSDPWANAPIGNKKKKSWKLDCWCFNPSLGMQDIVDRGVHSIVLTSGTLSPLGPMINELGVNFPVRLENPHIVKDNQVFVAVMTCGPDGTPLNSSYQNRSNEKYLSSMGRSISNFCRVVPDGLLVFFPSYSVMKANVSFWEDNGIWQNLSGLKPLFIEPQGKDAFQESIENYYSAIKNPDSKGAALLAVCRGKVSEGLDFADQNARAVVITGLPFPPSMDPRVKMKMSYLNNVAKEKNGLYGNDWYVLQASRAVNQAIGRVIRHKDDFGAILLCDNRFKDKRIQCQLSKWIQGRIHVFDSFGPILKHLSSFFKALGQNPNKSKHNVPSFGAFQMNHSVVCQKTETVKNQSESKEKNKNNSAAENIFEGYKHNPSDSQSNQNANSSSIFDVMDHQQQIPSPPIFANTISSQASSHATTSYFDSHSIPQKSQVPKKKRKISIALRQAQQPEDNLSPTEKWKKYLIEVKTLLGATHQYGDFCSAVKNFKTTKQVEKFALDMKNIFSNIPDCDNYLQTASLLVGSQDRGKFLALCS